MPSISEMFTTFVDKQRIERLEECVALEEAFIECKRLENMMLRTPHHSNQQDPPQQNPKRIEDTRVGMKISRFYGWGLTNPRAQLAIAQMRNDDTFGSLSYSAATATATANATSSKTNTISSTSRNNDTDPSNTTTQGIINASSTSSSCSMERHAIWACRALALQCAPDLVQLKTCFERTGNNNPSEDGYKDTHDDNNNNIISMDDSRNTCRMEMNKLAKCVHQHKMELDERLSIAKI